MHLQSFKPNSGRVRPNYSANSLRMKILRFNSFGWSILQGKFPLILYFQYFAGKVGEGCPAGDIIYIEYIDIIVHIIDWLSIEQFRAPCGC